MSTQDDTSSDSDASISSTSASQHGSPSPTNVPRPRTSRASVSTTITSGRQAQLQTPNHARSWVLATGLPTPVSGRSGRHSADVLGIHVLDTTARVLWRTPISETRHFLPGSRLSNARDDRGRRTASDRSPSRGSSATRQGRGGHSANSSRASSRDHSATRSVVWNDHTNGMVRSRSWPAQDDQPQARARSIERNPDSRSIEQTSNTVSHGHRSQPSAQPIATDPDASSEATSEPLQTSGRDEAHLEASRATDHPGLPQYPLVILGLPRWARLLIILLVLVIAIQYCILEARHAPFLPISRTLSQTVACIVMLGTIFAGLAFALELAYAFHFRTIDD